MRDAVADELAARARLDPAPGRFVAASVLAHAALVAALFAARLLDEAPEKKKVIHVRLAGRGTPVAATPSPIKDAQRQTPAQPAPPAPAETRVPMTRPAPPPPVPAVVPPKKASAGETLFGRSQQPAAPSAAPTTVQPPAQTKTPPAPVTKAPPVSSPSEGAAGGPIGVPGVGQAGILSLEGGPFPFNDYLERMIGLVGRRWQRPAIGSEPSATVYFIIERNGRIREAQIEESSGIGAFDRAALRAVLESSPLPPLPNNYGGNWLGVHLAFH